MDQSYLCIRALSRQIKNWRVAFDGLRSVVSSSSSRLSSRIPASSINSLLKPVLWHSARSQPSCCAWDVTGLGPTRNLCRRPRTMIAAAVTMQHFLHWSCRTPIALGSQWRWLRLRDPTGNINRIEANSGSASAQPRRGPYGCDAAFVLGHVAPPWEGPLPRYRSAPHLGTGTSTGGRDRDG